MKKCTICGVSVSRSLSNSKLVTSCVACCRFTHDLICGVDGKLYITQPGAKNATKAGITVIVPVSAKKSMWKLEKVHKRKFAHPSRSYKNKALSFPRDQYKKAEPATTTGYYKYAHLIEN